MYIMIFSIFYVQYLLDVAVVMSLILCCFITHSNVFGFLLRTQQKNPFYFMSQRNEFTLNTHYTSNKISFSLNAKILHPNMALNTLLLYTLSFSFSQQIETQINLDRLLDFLHNILLMILKYYKRQGLHFLLSRNKMNLMKNV